jgi:arylsulfatase
MLVVASLVLALAAQADTKPNIIVILVDIMPTIVEVAGAKYPGAPILPMEGRSLVPAFDNQPIQREALYWEHEGNAAIRVGDWKLVRLGRNGEWELYDLKNDRTELHNLAGTSRAQRDAEGQGGKPELAKELAAKWEAWAERAHVKPYPDAKKGKKK